MKASKLTRFILPPSSFILAFLRDGVIGNTSGFELEDEGSTPSPAAISHGLGLERALVRATERRTSPASKRSHEYFSQKGISIVTQAISESVR